MSAFPLPRSVLILDNASIHDHARVIAACHLHGVRVIFLPPYSYDFNPIEDAFHVAKARLRRDFDERTAGQDLKPKLEHALWNCCSPEMACNLFENCFFGLSPADILYAKN